MRTQNIVLFSSGISEQNGILMYVKQKLESQGYECCYWRDLFDGANDMKNIALLPMLIKKIPTFDFAILICEGHDETDMIREGKVLHTRTMRDNVLFEIGLCTMALGLNRVILLTDGTVRLPEDLHGIGEETALKVVSYTDGNQDTYQAAAAQMLDYLEQIIKRIEDPDVMNHVISDIDSHIQSNISRLYPTVIGASVATANGYMSNFILRTLEKCNMGLILDENPHELTYFEDNKIFMHIILPQEYSSQTPARSRIRMQSLSVGSSPSARYRLAEFRYRIENGDELHIYDFPTTLVTGYQTAKIILALDADDHNDINAQRRFNAKELDLFENALRSFIASEKFIRATVRHFYENDENIDEEKLSDRLIGMMKQIEIRREDY